LYPNTLKFYRKGIVRILQGDTVKIEFNQGITASGGMSESAQKITLKDGNPGPVEIVVFLTEHVKGVFIQAGCQDILMESGCSIQGRLYAKSSSGSIRLKNFTAQNITLTSGSGDIHADGLKGLQYLSLSTDSGYLGVTRLRNVPTLHIRNSSGNIYTSDTYSGVLDVTNISGKIDLNVSNTFSL
jgi:DUF4097 and DUF4098 domain-containing protein YvlB